MRANALRSAAIGYTGCSRRPFSMVLMCRFCCLATVYSTVYSIVLSTRSSLIVYPHFDTALYVYVPPTLQLRVVVCSIPSSASHYHASIYRQSYPFTTGRPRCSWPGCSPPALFVVLCMFICYRLNPCHRVQCFVHLHRSSDFLSHSPVSTRVFAYNCSAHLRQP